MISQWHVKLGEVASENNNPSWTLLVPRGSTYLSIKHSIFTNICFDLFVFYDPYYFQKELRQFMDQNKVQRTRIFRDRIKHRMHFQAGMYKTQSLLETGTELKQPKSWVLALTLSMWSLAFS